MKLVLPPNAKRVQLNTDKVVNERIHRDMVYHAAGYAGKSRDAISRRIKELDHEWDTERVLETVASVLILLSIILGFTKNFAWFYLSGAAAFFLLQHALQGWCPPLPMIRWLGVRTPGEINDEKMILKALRGDFYKRLN